MGCSYIFDMAYGIWQDLNEPTSLSFATISGHLTSSGYIGGLNIRLDKTHSIVSGCISPPLDSSEIHIYKELYKYQYYNKAVSQSLGAIGAVQWTNLREADSNVTRASPNETAKIYKALAKDVGENLQFLVNDYKANETSPESVDYYTIDNVESNIDTYYPR